MELYLGEAEGELCKRNFWEFVQRLWPEVVTETLIPNWHMKYICNVLQRMAERVVKRLPKEYDLIINVPPGSSKSTICSVMFPAWVWGRDPRLRSICASYAHDLSLDLATRSRDVVKSEFYQRHFKVPIREDRAAKGHFGNAVGGERISTSVGGSITGLHSHIIVVDDPVDPRGAASEAELVDANNWLGTTLSQRKVDKAMTPTIMIMQRLDPADPTQYLLDKVEEGKKIRHISLPCDILPHGETGEKWEVKPARLKVHYENQGGYLDPKRLGQDTLDEALIDLGPRVYAGQMGQAPRELEGNMFLRRGFVIVDTLPDKVLRRVRYWDKAGTEGGKGAATAGVRLAELRNGMWAVEDCVHGRWRASEREFIIKETAKADGVEVEVVLEQEPGSGGKESAQATVRNLAGFKVLVDIPGGKGSKEVRAEPWSVQVNNGNVVLLRGSWNVGYISEHCDFPSGLKDRVDGSSGAFNHITGLGKKKKRGGIW